LGLPAFLEPAVLAEQQELLVGSPVELAVLHFVEDMVFNENVTRCNQE
jgi:hypothetical protein